MAPCRAHPSRVSAPRGRHGPHVFVRGGGPSAAPDGDAPLGVGRQRAQRDRKPGLWLLRARPVQSDACARRAGRGSAVPRETSPGCLGLGLHPPLRGAPTERRLSLPRLLLPPARPDERPAALPTASPLAARTPGLLALGRPRGTPGRPDPAPVRGPRGPPPGRAYPGGGPRRGAGGVLPSTRGGRSGDGPGVGVPADGVGAGGDPL